MTMARRDPRLQALRRHRVPAWWRDAKLGIFVHWTPASVPAFAPVDVDIGDLVQSDRADALADLPYAEWYENSLRFPTARSPATIARSTATAPTRPFADDWEAGLAHWDPEDWAGASRPPGPAGSSCVTKHMDGYCLWPTEVTNPHRPGWHCRRDVVGELGEAVRGAGMRFGVYYSGGLDATFNDRPIGSVADLIDAVPRGDYPAYAEAQVRELIARYRPSVLWNDIAWPSEGKALWPLFEHYYEQVPDGVSTTAGCRGARSSPRPRSPRVRKLLDAGARRQARRDGGIVPPRPPHSDYRTPEYVELRRRPAEALGVRPGHGPELRLQRPVPPGALHRPRRAVLDAHRHRGQGRQPAAQRRPRGVDAQIPDEQRTRLDWLGQWVGPNQDALVATRPWVRAGTTTTAGVPVRYTARDDTVFAFVRGAAGPVTLPDVAPTPSTRVTTVAGADLSWQDTATGITVDRPDAPSGSEPSLIALHHVAAR